VAHNLERIADRAVNIGERITFIVAGRLPNYRLHAPSGASQLVIPAICYLLHKDGIHRAKARASMLTTIVVVDDDPDTLDFLDLLLTSRGLTVVLCDHSCDPVELIQQSLPDVVLLDMQNGQDRESGMDILVRLRADDLTATTPVIVMSGDHDVFRHHAARLSDLRADSLRKPFEPEQMFTQIEQSAE
jgi:CheY-like chemotaxis protein